MSVPRFQPGDRARLHGRLVTILEDYAHRIDPHDPRACWWKIRFEGTGAIHIVADCNLLSAEEPQ